LLQSINWNGGGVLANSGAFGYPARVKILIAGASGFIGTALIERLLQDETLEVVALSRGNRESRHPRLVWKRCDLFSLKDLHEAMTGCEAAYYLVHSMLPSADLAQGSFYDFDLILADNFARSAKKFGLKHIIYLGGMIPEKEVLSWHLRSRLEVEEALRSSGVPVTTLRAGLIIGAHGSSFEILHRLVERLPLMVCPAWTRTESQPIALEEILQVLVECMKRPEFQGRTFDVGGPEVLTYQELILRTARTLGLRRRVYSFNLIPLRISRWWVKLITGASKNLVYPLVLSLKHRMVADPAIAWKEWPLARIPLESAIRDALRGPRTRAQALHPMRPREHEVRSIQRLYHPKGRNAEWVASEYFRWLPGLFGFLIRVTVRGNRCTFSFLWEPFRLLVLEKSVERSTPDRQLLYIRGGLLASSKMERGRLEFREALNGRLILAAIHEFIPALPWTIYRFTQALMHLWVMHRFQRHLLTVDPE
jgi:uncharacterized protein YbjT (DUF2867 family)